ncbi:hypothetical protein HD806DRAFT_452865 [Xylariaceae sp. AK1471]|nr:hypothetical protein HD806DRAFT_452865 [Xylariaceae sp. AK1471]
MSSSETLKGPPRHQPKALEAALWLFETQKAQLAQDPNRPRSSISSTRNAADKFGVSKSSVARQLAALKTGKPNASTGTRVGRPSRFTEAEEQMLGFHTFMLRREKRPVSMKVVQDAADALLSRRKPPGPPVSGSWVRRWLRADRAQARAEAISKGAGTLPGLDLVDAEMENDDEDVDLGEDAPSEMETEDPNLNENSSLNLSSNSTTGREQLVSTAVEALTTIKSS